MKEPFCGARTYLNILLLAQIIVGLLIMFVTAIYYWILTSYLVQKDRKLLYGQIFNFYLISIQIIILFLGSCLLWMKLWGFPYSKDVNMFVNMWLFLCGIIILFSFGTTWSVSACVDEMEASAETSLLNGIDVYYTCPDSKLLWDELQLGRQCCGVNSYTDWMGAIWITVHTNGIDCASDATTYAPYACCRRDCPSCFENYAPNSNNIGNFNLTQINTVGCLPKFTKNLWRLIYIVIGLLMVALKVMAFICVLVRFILRKQCSCSTTSCTSTPCTNSSGSCKQTTSSASCTNPGIERSSSYLFEGERMCGCRPTCESEIIH